VLTLITTSVRTAGFEKDDVPRVPESSYYAAIRGYIERLAAGQLQDGAPDARVYAVQVVREIEKGKTGEVWVGKDAGVSMWMWRVLPRQWMVSSELRVCLLRKGLMV
jgi:hypothetical protein